MKSKEEENRAAEGIRAKERGSTKDKNN